MHDADDDTERPMVDTRPPRGVRQLVGGASCGQVDHPRATFSADTPHELDDQLDAWRCPICGRSAGRRV